MSDTLFQPSSALKFVMSDYWAILTRVSSLEHLKISILRPYRIFTDLPRNFTKFSEKIIFVEAFAEFAPNLQSPMVGQWGMCPKWRFERRSNIL